MGVQRATEPTVDQLDHCLPQTQCTQCGYAGCRPYADALTKGEAANRCVPGGQALANQLAERLNRPWLPVLEGRLGVDEQGQPPQVRAVIREQECIGCTKCLTACPVDAIVGARKRMHTILADWCTGCELCIPPCPVDCIDLVTVRAAVLPDPPKLRARFEHHQQRVGRFERRQLPDHPLRLKAAANPDLASVSADHPLDQAALATVLQSVSRLPSLIAQATLRSQLARLERQADPSPADYAQQHVLRAALAQLMD